MLVVLLAASLLAPVEIGEAIAVEPADEACLSREAVAQAVGGWLGTQRIDARIAIEIDAGPEAIGFRLKREGEVRVERSLSPAPGECADRRAAIGLSVAMALDATVLGTLVPEVEPVQPESEPETPPELEPEPTPEPEPEALPEEEPEPRPRSVRIALVGSGVVAYGVAPGLGFGGEVGLELGFVPWLDVGVSAGALGGLAFALGGGEVSTTLVAGALEVCPARAFGRWRPRLCVGGGGGALLSRSRGFESPRSPTLPWFAIDAGGDLDVAVASRVALRIGARAVAPLIRNTLDVRDQANMVVDAEDGQPIGVTGSVGVVVRLSAEP